MGIKCLQFIYFSDLIECAYNTKHHHHRRRRNFFGNTKAFPVKTEIEAILSFVFVNFLSLYDSSQWLLLSYCMIG